jgi:hypothetical protein
MDTLQHNMKNKKIININANKVFFILSYISLIVSAAVPLKASLLHISSLFIR